MERPILWGRGSSTNVQKVIWALHELAIEYEHRIVGRPHGGTDTEEFGALNPNRKVPVWQADDIVLWESQAILRHLARSHGQLYGQTLQDQAIVDRWLDWSALVFWPPARTLFLDYYQAGHNPSTAPAAEQMIASIRSSLTVAETLIQDRSFLIGQHFTIADIGFGIALNRTLGMDFGLEPGPQISRWHRNVTARQAFAAVLADEPTLK